MGVTVQLADKENNIEMVTVTSVTKQPRYYGKVVYYEEVIEDEINNIKDACKFFININKDEYNVKALHNFDIEDDDLLGNKIDDFDVFQKKIQEQYPDKYNCYFLVTHIHSGISFNINTTGSGSCRWDSGCVGFITIPKDNEEYGTVMTDPDQLSNYLTSLYMGDIYEYQIWDMLNDEMIDSTISVGYSSVSNLWKKDMAEKYNINWDELERQL